MTQQELENLNAEYVSIMFVEGLEFGHYGSKDNDLIGIRTSGDNPYYLIDDEVRNFFASRKPHFFF